MAEDRNIYRIEDIEFSIIFSGRRSIGISVRPDSSVIVRAPYRTSLKTINRIVTGKYSWVLKHRDNYRNLDNSSRNKLFISGETHLYRGTASILKIEKSSKPYIRFYDSTIDLGINNTEDPELIKRLLYKGYKNEAVRLFPELMNKVISEQHSQMFKPTGLVIRTMKRRWGSCSSRGKITLSTELIKLSDFHIEYVITHELCHLKHHNHGAHFYELLSELFPEWKSARKALRTYIQ
jgi:predicted metal-dependent hydrolase